MEFCFAPLELGLVCDRCGYKHSAPAELNAWLKQQVRTASYCCCDVS
jgi:hypothetical protein